MTNHQTAVSWRLAASCTSSLNIQVTQTHCGEREQRKKFWNSSRRNHMMWINKPLFYSDSGWFNFNLFCLFSGFRTKKKNRSSWKICSVMFCLNDDYHVDTSLKSRDHANIRCYLRRKSRHHANIALWGQTENTLSCSSKHLSIKTGDEGIFKCFRCVLWRKFLQSHSTYSITFQPYTIW